MATSVLVPVTATKVVALKLAGLGHGMLSSPCAYGPRVTGLQQRSAWGSVSALRRDDCPRSGASAVAVIALRRRSVIDIWLSRIAEHYSTFRRPWLTSQRTCPARSGTHSRGTQKWPARSNACYGGRRRRWLEVRHGSVFGRPGSAVDLWRLQDGCEGLERGHPIRSDPIRWGEHDGRCPGCVSGSDAFPYSFRRAGEGERVNPLGGERGGEGLSTAGVFAKRHELGRERQRGDVREPIGLRLSPNG